MNRNVLVPYLGFASVFALFQLVATAMGSLRGEAGFVVAAVVLAALGLLELSVHGTRPVLLIRRLGLGWPSGSGLLTAFVLSLLLVAVVPVTVSVTGGTVMLVPGWMWLLPGLFAQAGIAEESLFRAYLFGRLRSGRGFWRAAGLAAMPFAAAHLYLLTTLSWPVALATIMLSVSLTFPLARLYEFAGSTIWAPALIHMVIQATPKLIHFDGHSALLPAWLAASALVPLLVFALPAEPSRQSEV